MKEPYIRQTMDKEMDKETVAQKAMAAESDVLIRELRELANTIEDHRTKLNLWGTIIKTVRPLEHITFGDITGENGTHLIVDLNKLSDAYNQWFRVSEDNN